MNKRLLTTAVAAALTFTGTAHALDSHSFPVPVMGKTGTTNNYRDALFVGSTFGPGGITVAVRIGFDDNRSLGAQETGTRTALPVFREIILKVYKEKLVGPAPQFPAQISERAAATRRAILAGRKSVPAPALSRRRGIVPGGIDQIREIRQGARCFASPRPVARRDEPERSGLRHAGRSRTQISEGVFKRETRRRAGNQACTLLKQTSFRQRKPNRFFPI